MPDRTLVRVRSISVLEGFRVRLGFSNGEARDVDLGRYLRGPIFQPMRDDPSRFREVAVDARAGTITWPNGADIDPDVLYHDIDPSQLSPPASVLGAGVLDDAPARRRPA
jgi:hypothetical protein